MSLNTWVKRRSGASKVGPAKGFVAASKAADVMSEKASTTVEHKAAAEAHLAVVGMMKGGTHRERHLMLAEKHASAAGGEWDESKHPRDAKGMFTGISSDTKMRKHLNFQSR